MTEHPAVRIVAALALAAALTAPATAQPIRTEPVVRGLQDAWALAFLPDGRRLVTEKGGSLRVVSADGRLGAPLAGLPSVSVGGQCGLLDVVADPAFASNQRIFFTFAEPGEGGNSTAVGRAKLVGAAGSERLEYLYASLVHRPGPRRDQRTHPDPLADDPGRAAHLLPMEGFRRLQRGFNMHLPRPHLSAPRPFDRRAHFGGHHLGKLFVAFVVDLQHPTQDSDTFGHRPHGPAIKGRPCRRNGRIDIGLIAQGDFGHDLFGRGVFNPHARRRMRRDPLAIDIELIHI
jgi:hypothetical protein